MVSVRIRDLNIHKVAFDVRVAFVQIGNGKIDFRQPGYHHSSWTDGMIAIGLRCNCNGISTDLFYDIRSQFKLRCRRIQKPAVLRIAVKRQLHRISFRIRNFRPGENPRFAQNHLLVTIQNRSSKIAELAYVDDSHAIRCSHDPVPIGNQYNTLVSSVFKDMPDRLYTIPDGNRFSLQSAVCHHSNRIRVFHTELYGCLRSDQRKPGDGSKIDFCFITRSRLNDFQSYSSAAACNTNAGHAGHTVIGFTAQTEGVSTLPRSVQNCNPVRDWIRQYIPVAVRCHLNGFLFGKHRSKNPSGFTQGKRFRRRCILLYDGNFNPGIHCLIIAVFAPKLE